MANCPHLENVKVYRSVSICREDKITVGTSCTVDDTWLTIELGSLDHVSRYCKEPIVQQAIDAYMEGEPGKCHKSCEFYNVCNKEEM